ncbi:MAG: hypothetical protein J6R08_04610 [Opitutales bacterium]|nr:hypothetical protein [Opitutales bacterium]
MKKLAIVLPIFSFALFCALASILGAVAGFFCVLALEDGFCGVPAQSSPSCVVDFLKDKSRRREKFSVSGFKGEISKILYEDFCKKGVSAGEILFAPDFELDGDTLKVSIAVNSPVLFLAPSSRLSFYFKISGGRAAFSGAALARAKIPLPIAKIILKIITRKYLECGLPREAAEAFSNCGIEAENGFLILEK